MQGVDLEQSPMRAWVQLVTNIDCQSAAWAVQGAGTPRMLYCCTPLTTGELPASQSAACTAPSNHQSAVTAPPQAQAWAPRESNVHAIMLAGMFSTALACHRSMPGRPNPTRASPIRSGQSNRCMPQPATHAPNDPHGALNRRVLFAGVGLKSTVKSIH